MVSVDCSDRPKWIQDDMDPFDRAQVDAFLSCRPDLSASDNVNPRPSCMNATSVTQNHLDICAANASLRSAPARMPTHIAHRRCTHRIPLSWNAMR